MKHHCQQRKMKWQRRIQLAKKKNKKTKKKKNEDDKKVLKIVINDIFDIQIMIVIHALRVSLFTPLVQFVCCYSFSLPFTFQCLKRN